MFEDFSGYIHNLNLNPGTSKKALSDAAEKLGVSLPQQYLEFMRFSNGAEGFVGSSYLMLWTIEELESFNRELEVAEYAPGLLLIGSDGGGEAYAIDTRNNSFGMVLFIGMELDALWFRGNTFLEFLDFLAKDK